MRSQGQKQGEDLRWNEEEQLIEERNVELAKKAQINIKTS